MRFVLRKLKDQNGWSQGETGRRLGIGQQAAGVILNKHGGFSRPTALELAKMCGFASPEDMLDDLGALADPKAAPSGWWNRDLAVGAARRIGYPEQALALVIARFAGDRYANMPSRWWMDRIVNVAAELEAESAVPAPPSEATIPADAATQGKQTA
jgi:hypothetical protein